MDVIFDLYTTNQNAKLNAVPDITISPHFQSVVSQTALTCIFQFQIGQALSGIIGKVDGQILKQNAF
ncbi:hypothetical protein CHI06_26045 [Bacillus sp. 7884-1]|nr:hypothetical protein CHI06_26045 [Bacillus sp. 7884-1]